MQADTVNNVLGNVRLPRLTTADLIAGISVALVLIPQSLAYAQIAEMPVVTGLFAAAIPLIVSAPFASSPYLQTGPVALTGLLTLAALQGAGYSAADPNYVVLGSLLALMVGGIRIMLSVLRAGWVAYLAAEPVMLGFTSAAAAIIIGSQLPKALGTSTIAPDGSAMSEAWWTITHPEQWNATAIGVSLVTLVLMLGGRRLHSLFPGVAIAVVAGLVFSKFTDDPGLTVGDPVGVPEGLPNFGLDLPWSSAGSLLVGAIVIALVGFAEPSAIARIYAAQEKVAWNANRELFAQGIANLASAFSGAFPVGGSFSRSALNHLSGARSRWSGMITGIVVLCFLPFASVLNPLPQAVLGALVIGAVLKLLQPKRLASLWRYSWVEAGLAWLTFVASLILASRIQYAIMIGILAAAVVHFARPLQLVARDEATVDDAATPTKSSSNSPKLIRPTGLLWIASYETFEEQLEAAVDEAAGSNLVVDLGSDPTLDPRVEEIVAQAQARMRISGGTLQMRHCIPANSELSPT